ncbi:MAG: AAA family ATPase, partial [Proteobacteria bacterium]|nr:AAA family ATPase [Pseudomonadota bacterium]
MSQSLFARFRNEITKVYVGEDDTIQALVVALIAGGHVLIEGNPGLAKTTLAQTLASCIAGTFRRVQFTIDLLPSDITGANIYRLHDGTFQFIPGPVFTHVLLADELNRAPAKTQSALLEAMQERQVTVDTETHPLPRPFIVLATQNPHEDQGTYPLPDSQLDRFMFRLRLGYPTPAQELQIIHFASRAPQTPSPVLTPEACL